MAVLAAVLLVVGVLTDVLVAAQTRSDLDTRLQARAGVAAQLVEQGLRQGDLVRQVENPGVRAFVTGSDGTIYRDGPGAGGRGRIPDPRNGDRVVRSSLPDGSTLTLVGDEGEVSSAQRRLRRTLFLLSVGALVLAGLITLATTRVALAPLDAMTALARSITRGDRGSRLAPSRTDTELGRTAAAFDAMLDELEGAEATARASEARTRRFVADAAHELRTPLAGVQAAAEAAVAPGLAAEDRDRLHLLLLRETHRAGRLVDDLLVLARIDAGIELRREPVDLLELARTEVERVRLRAPRLDVRLTGDPVTAPGDAPRLAQVLANLLDNACRHTAGRIEVRVRAPGVVTVSDDGTGVAPADRERIFERLVRLDEARSADDGGAGLGLAIARGIARAHGGDLGCVEPVDGRGATFELRLPLSDRRAQSSSAGEALRT
jgi:signal transduction histidine kinase